MSFYLHDVPLSAAQMRFEQALQSAELDHILGSETIPLDENALGRVLAEPVWARLSSPHYHASAMDGFAVRARDTDGASLTAPISLQVGEQAQYVNTGDALPAWANAVIMIEQTEPLDAKGRLSAEVRAPHAIRIRAAVPPWKHVRALGEDMVAGELVLPTGHTLRPVDLGAIAGCGHDTVSVARRPRVAILPTGSELKPIGAPVAAGDIIEYNALVLAAQVRDWGGEPTRFSITPDNREAIRARVLEAAQEHDLILLNAGSSAGSEDFSAEIIRELGDLLVHGVAVRPGHPVILGLISHQLSAISLSPFVPIIGVPGYPVSAAMTGEIFVKPLLHRWLGKAIDQPQTIEATLTRKLASPSGDDDYVRVAVGRVGDRVLAAPMQRGAGVISSLVRADGIVIVPRGAQGHPAGAAVRVNLLRDSAEIDRTIFAVGSHDMSLDLLAQFLAQRNRRLTSANVGSLGGLVALRRGHAHFAGSHLLDPETGTYNTSYLPRYLPDTPVQLVTLVGRQQGLIIRSNNPKRIMSLSDLVRPDVRFVNRQRGAGTRVLLDYELEKDGISAETISGYEQEEYTHLAVAAAVASGRADCGLGIAAAAQALDLDFVPLFEERYDLVIAAAYAHSDLLAPLFDVLADADFRHAVAQLPGYDVSAMGTVVPLS